MTLLCFAHEIDEAKGKSIYVGEHKLFAVKRDDQVFVYRNTCPHLGVELNWQEDMFMDMEGVLIQCATHGALFLPESGQCVSGPCHGQYLQAVATEMQGDGVFLTEPLN